MRVGVVGGQVASGLFEQLIDDGASTGLIVLAPHGGWIERHTDAQAARLQSLLAERGASAWICRGYEPGGGSYERWHIPSTQIERGRFAGLDRIAERGFAHAVAFHGCRREGVVVGGGAPERLRVAVRDAIRGAVRGTGIEVELSTAAGLYPGDSPENVVNWLTAGGRGGVQIEQGLRAREAHGEPIVEAVASVFRGLI